MLTDLYSRRHSYLRISITDKCNLRCRYCMPSDDLKFLTHDEVLRNEEFIRLIKIFAGMGISKVRFTGGEPLLRKGLMGILEETRALFPDMELCLTTNGVLLAGYLDKLINLRVKKLNISLDTLSRDRYRELAGVDAFDEVFHNINIAEKTGFFNLKINAVLLRETLDELDHFLEHFKDRNLMLRFIERMPFTKDEGIHFIPSAMLLDELKKRGTLIRDSRTDTHVATMYRFNYRDSYAMKIGVISPISEKFCSACNRLRLKADGGLRTCLLSGSEIDLKTPLRNGAGDEELMRIITGAVRDKGKEHDLERRHEENGCTSLKAGNPMSSIGG